MRAANSLPTTASVVARPGPTTGEKMRNRRNTRNRTYYPRHPQSQERRAKIHTSFTIAMAGANAPNPARRITYRCNRIVRGILAEDGASILGQLHIAWADLGEPLTAEIAVCKSESLISRSSSPSYASYRRLANL